jgi:osmoprotectant transport system substrate-binding protein
MGVQLSHRLFRSTTNKAGSWPVREGKSTVDPIRGKTDISCVYMILSLARLCIRDRWTDRSPTRATKRARRIVTRAVLSLLAICVPVLALAQTLVVGGKDFTEQLLMAELTAQLLTAKGFQVEKRSGYDTTRLRQAQEAGVVDLYWEYTGTSLREFNKITEQLSAAETYALVKQLDAEKGLVWLKPSRVNNTYGLAMRRADATEKGIATISELAAKVGGGERLIFASNPEFYERSDGLRPLERAYGFQFGRDRVVRLDTDLIYQVLRDLKLIDVGLVFATDARVSAYDLLVLKDDKEFFPDYAMTPVIRKPVLEQHPDLEAHLGRLSDVLDSETMASLNRRIDVDRVRLPQVASEFLRTHGLL